MTTAARNECRHFDGQMLKRMMDSCRSGEAPPYIYFDILFRSAILAFESEFAEEYPDLVVDASDLLDSLIGLLRRKLRSGKSRISNAQDIAALVRLQDRLEQYCACRESAWVIRAFWG